MDVKEEIGKIKETVEEKIKDIDIKEVAEKVKEGSAKGVSGLKDAAGEIIGKVTGKGGDK